MFLRDSLDIICVSSDLFLIYDFFCFIFISFIDTPFNYTYYIYIYFSTFEKMSETTPHFILNRFYNQDTFNQTFFRCTSCGFFFQDQLFKLIFINLISFNNCENLLYLYTLHNKVHNLIDGIFFVLFSFYIKISIFDLQVFLLIAD